MSRTMSNERNKRICELYSSGNHTTMAIAASFMMSRRRVAQIVKAAGVVRTQAEANRIAARLKPKHRIRKRSYDLPPVKRGVPLSAVRYRLLKEHPWCAVCGARPTDGARLEIDHIDNNPLNNDESNFQVLCNQCNHAKYYAEGQPHSAQGED